MVTIEKVIYRENSIDVFLETSEKYSCSYSILSSLSLSSGMKLDMEAYRFLQEESELFTCREKALRYLAIRQRSEFEIRQYLKKKKYSSNIIDSVVRFLHERSYLNDLDFGISYIQSIVNRKPAGVPLLKQKLYSKGITGKTAEKAIKQSGCDNPDIESLTDLARKKLRSLDGKPGKQEKLYRYLLGRGFNYETVSKTISCLDEYLQDNDS